MAKKNPNDSTSTKIPGVRKHTRSGKYISTVTKFVGRFDSIQEAAKAREQFLHAIDRAIAGLKPKRKEATA